MKKIRGMCHRGIPWFGVLVIAALAFGFHAVGVLSEQGQVSAWVEAENAYPQTLDTGDELITDSGSYKFYGSYGDGIPRSYGNEAVAVNAVGPEVAQPGDKVVIEFMISADPDHILLRAYQVSPPCALVPQDGATGTVEVVSVSVDTGRSDWVMCGAGCDCTCDGFPLLDMGDCDNAGFDPRVGWTATSGEDSALVGVGPAYLAEVSYMVSPDASGGFNFEFVDPETADGGLGSLLRDPDSQHILANWNGTKLVIVECTDEACDDGNECTDDFCDPGHPEAGSDGCVHDYQVQVYGDICLPYDPPDSPQPSLDDILCILDDFANGAEVDGCECDGFRKTTDLHPCPEDGGGDGSLNVDDILKVLDRFTGRHSCEDPCPPL